jgi:glycosyltransferase involved in cell wall biosynthesis
MNVGMLLNAPYPNDVRVKKEIEALQSGGHKVYLLCTNGGGEKTNEIYECVNITRINVGSSKALLTLWDIIMSVTFIHPLFRFKITKWLVINNIKVIHVHDLPLVGTALFAKKRFSISVIADFHENYPDALGVWFQWKRNLLIKFKNFLFMNPSRWRKLEKRAVRECDRVIAVVEEMKNRLQQMYGVDASKIEIVSNTEDNTFTKQPLNSEIYGARLQNKFIVAYSGNIGPHRGVDTLVESMQYLQEFEDIAVAIIGSGNKAVMDNIHSLIDKYRLQDKVFLLGRQPFHSFYSFMHYSSVNIIPHKSNTHTDNTVPHKLFQAMLSGRPLIVSSSAPLKRIIEESRAGLVFEAGNPKDLSEKIFYLYKNLEKSMTMAANGIEYTRPGKKNWNVDGKVLLAIYNSLKNEK